MAGALFQHATDALLLVDPLTERVLDANDQACVLISLSREDLLGTPLRELLRHEQEWQDWPPLHEKSFAANEGFLLQSGREDRWVEVGVRIRRLPLPGAGLTALVALTDRRAEADLARRLQRAKAELRGIVAGASDCLWSCRIDAEGRWRYRYLSPAVQRLTGRGPGVFLDDPEAWEASVEPHDLHTWRLFRDRQRAGRSGSADYRLRRPEGPTVWVHENVVASSDERGIVLSGVMTDISERKREMKTPPAPHRDRLDCVAGLAAGLAHDFNNLLTGILGHLSLARMSPEPFEGLEQIEAITLRAADLCMQLSVIGGRRNLGVQTRDVGRIIREAAMQAMSAPRRPEVELPDDLPAFGIDEGQLRQLVEALVRNAAQATDISFGEVVVRAGVGVPPNQAGVPGFAYPMGEGEGPIAWIEVRDTGPGISREVLSRLGEPFVNARPGLRGMGLALVVGIVRGHQGGLEVYTTEGRGTMVRVLLRAASEPVVTGDGFRFEPGGEHCQGTVLLADDEENVREVAARLLRSAGCEVVATRDGEEALAVLRERCQEVQLALVDLTMPRLCGEALMRELRQVAPGLPVVLMSGYAEADVGPRFAGWGLTGYLQKPFRLPALLGLLRRVLPAPR